MKNCSKIKFAILLFILLLATLVTACSCKHEYEGGKCTLCGEADPNYKPTCSHSYVAGVCEDCGSVCSHSYDNGVCKTCNLECTHSYSGGVCSKCGVSCPHSYADGACSRCGIACTHSYSNGICTKCNLRCTHSYSDGICNSCGFECTHSYTNAVCTKCGFKCPHNYVDGVCTECSVFDPAYTEADAGRSLYDDIVDEFKYLVLYKHTNEELPPREENDPYEPFYIEPLYEAVGHYDPTKSFGYAFKDIDKDGYVELLLTENGVRLYAIFTIKNEEPKLVATFQSGMGYLADDGTVFFITKGLDDMSRQIHLGYHMMHLVDGALSGFTYGWDDIDEDYETDDTEYFYISEAGVRTVLSYEEYRAYSKPRSYYWEHSTRVTKLSHLKFEAALPETTITRNTADFSSYDAIIRTFEIMYSKILSGKNYWTHWTQGKYNNGMLFDSEEDFVLYDKLMAACALVQGKGNNAVFGYAKSDLNADGVEELIILESDFYVLAIFTEVDGKAVLLDSYTDLRTAFIDENGLIHVRVQVVPGSSADFEYCVYEISGGALVVKAAIGKKCDFDGNQTQIYKIINGEHVSIEQSEWDTLYAQYLLDIADKTYEAYTKEKAGLVFVTKPEESEE